MNLHWSFVSLLTLAQHLRYEWNNFDPNLLAQLMPLTLHFKLYTFWRCALVMLYMIAIFFTEESSICFLSRHFDHVADDRFSRRREKLNGKLMPRMWNPVTQPAKVMSRYISVIVLSAQFAWNELTLMKCFFFSIHPPYISRFNL